MYYMYQPWYGSLATRQLESSTGLKSTGHLPYEMMHAPAQAGPKIASSGFDCKRRVLTQGLITDRMGSYTRGVSASTWRVGFREVVSEQVSEQASVRA